MYGTGVLFEDRFTIACLLRKSPWHLVLIVRSFSVGHCAPKDVYLGNWLNYPLMASQTKTGWYVQGSLISGRRLLPFFAQEPLFLNAVSVEALPLFSGTSASLPGYYACASVGAAFFSDPLS
jgi:hypothetical protein